MLEKYKNYLNTNDYNFAQRVINTEQNMYIQRLKKINFINLNNVLDAGCGFGQWSKALSLHNTTIHAIDSASERLIVASEINKQNNIFYKFGKLEDIPYKNDSFDAIFCYGVFFITEPVKALKEFHRVLKTNGRAYITLNGIGWYLNYWINEPNKSDSFLPKESTAKAFANSFNFSLGLNKANDGGMFFEKDEFVKLVEHNGFKVIEINDEGCIDIQSTKTEDKPFFQSEYFGQTGVFEILIEKQE